MKCLACDKILSPIEATNRSSITMEFLDLCIGCIKAAGIQHIENPKNVNIDEEVQDDDLLYDELYENDSLGG